MSAIWVDLLKMGNWLLLRCFFKALQKADIVLEWVNNAFSTPKYPSGN